MKRSMKGDGFREATNKNSEVLPGMMEGEVEALESVLPADDDDEDEDEVISPHVSAEHLTDMDTSGDKPQLLVVRGGRSSLLRCCDW